MTALGRSFYDVVVVGGSLAAVATGALLARRGFRVAWVRHDDRAYAYSWDGLALPRTSSAITVAETPAFRRIMSELALMPVVRRRLVSSDPLFQVALPGHRVDVRPSPEALLAELEREFPEIRRPVEEFYNVVRRATPALDTLFGADVTWPPEGFFERREAARVAAAVPFARDDAAGGDALAHFPATHPFRAFVMAQARFATALDPDGISGLRLLRAHGNAVRSCAFFEGGPDALLRLLEEKILQHGGEVRSRDRVARVLVAGGRVEGVELATTDERLGCAFVITSLDASSAYRLAEHAASRATAERLLERTPRYHRYVVNVVLPAPAVPVGMASRVFSVVDEKRPLAEENLLSVETAAPDARGRCVMTASALLPRSGVEEGEAFLRWQRDRMLKSLGRLVPFVDRNVLAIDSPHDGLPLETRGGGETEVPVTGRRAEAEPMAVVESAEPRGYLGVCALPSRTEVRGLLLVGRQVVPGLGDEGELLAALSAARIVTRTDRSKEKLRRELWSKVEA